MIDFCRLWQTHFRRGVGRVFAKQMVAHEGLRLKILALRELRLKIAAHLLPFRDTNLCKGCKKSWTIITGWLLFFWGPMSSKNK